MTIDEAIAKYKEITNTDSNCPAYCNISCDKCVQESEQLAEWLEELKALKNGLNIKCDNLNEALEKGKKIGYNKAIDDCKELTFREVVYRDSLNDRTEFRELAEQLKAGANNGTDNK